MGGQTRASVPTLWHHLRLTRRFLYIKETLSFYQRNAPFVCKQHYSRPSPFGEGTGVRLVVDGGEAFGQRLNISKNEASRQRETTELTQSI